MTTGSALIVTAVVVPVLLLGVGTLLRFFVGQITASIDRLTRDVSEVRRDVAKMVTDVRVVTHDIRQVNEDIRRIDGTQREHERRITTLES